MPMLQSKSTSTTEVTEVEDDLTQKFTGMCVYKMIRYNVHMIGYKMSKDLVASSV